MSVLPEPVLIYRLGSLGDTVVALPCFHAIERAFPGRPKIVLTNVPVSAKAAALEVILRPGGFIDGAIDYPVGTRSLKALWRLRRAIRATGARTLIYLTAARGSGAARRDALFFRLCGIRVIVGLPMSSDLQHGHQTADGVEPEAERLARTLGALETIDLADRANWNLRFTTAELERAETALAPLHGTAFIGINMGGKEPSNDWGDDNWQALLTRLAPRNGALGLIAVGAPADFDRAGEALGAWPGPTVNLCGLLSPRESGAALAKADLFIGHDSGPMHLAAASGIPVLGLFGNFNPPRKWHPYGPRNRALHDMRGVRSIAVEDVAMAAEAMLP